MSQNNVINKMDINKNVSSDGERKIIKTHKREYSIYIPYDEKLDCKKKKVL